jgi:hypothetical protein
LLLTGSLLAQGNALRILGEHDLLVAVLAVTGLLLLVELLDE